MSDTATTGLHDVSASRRRQRLERQARVGLLRNPNTAPKPPTRRAALMGKWLDLRSSRRRLPTADDVEKPVPETVEPIAKIEEAVSHDENGGVSRINIDGLMQVVRDLGADKPIRTPYGSGYRGALDTDEPVVPKSQRVSILSAQAWQDEDSESHPEPAPLQMPTSRRRRRRLNVKRGLMIVVSGVLMAVVVLLLLPPIGAIPP